MGNDEARRRISAYLLAASTRPSVREIAEAVGCSTAVVMRVLAELSSVMRNVGNAAH
jgi:hypothetical protein